MENNKVFYTIEKGLSVNGEPDNKDITIRTDDGGVTTIHHNEDHFVTTYYQSRNSDYEVDWESLAQGKVYHKDWDKSKNEGIDDEMINDSLSWLVVGDCQFIEHQESEVE